MVSVTSTRDKPPMGSNGAPIPITVSGGIAQLRLDHADPVQFVDCADQSLFEAKRRGRDQVVACGSPGPSVVPAAVPVSEPINCVDGRPGTTVAQARDGQIWLSRRAFGNGTKYLASTLIEEHIHLAHGFGDCTRELQNLLFERLVHLGEQLQGELL